MWKRIAIGILALSVVGSGGAYFLYRQVIDMGYEPCVLSIESEFGSALQKPGSELSQRIRVTDNWRTLDEEEERMLFDEFRGRSFDCYQFPEFANGEALRGDKGTIKVRNDGELIRFWIEAENSVDSSGRMKEN